MGKGLELRLLADKSEGERIRMRVFPAEAVVDLGDGRLAVPLDQLEPILVNPATEGYEHEPWPLAGMEIEGKPPKAAIIPTGWVEKKVAEGLVSLEGERMVHRPGGPPDAPWRRTHSFRHADAIVLHCLSGDVRYTVVENPDKWPDETNELDEGFGGEVRWVYRARLA